MIDSTDVSTSPGDVSPRRAAVRTLGFAGAALLGLAGRDQGPAKGKTGKNGRKKHKKRHHFAIGLTSAESEPFSPGAGQGAVMKASCPEGFIAISGGLEGVDPVTAPCMIRESHDEPDGSAWVINVFCTEATNTPLKVGVICFSRDSFRLEG